MSRRSSDFPVDLPKFAFVMSVFGPFRFGWFGKLKISVLNWIFRVPPIEKFLKNAMSHCWLPGP